MRCRAYPVLLEYIELDKPLKYSEDGAERSEVHETSNLFDTFEPDKLWLSHQRPVHNGW